MANIECGFPERQGKMVSVEPSKLHQGYKDDGAKLRTDLIPAECIEGVAWIYKPFFLMFG